MIVFSNCDNCKATGNLAIYKLYHYFVSTAYTNKVLRLHKNREAQGVACAQEKVHFS